MYRPTLREAVEGREAHQIGVALCVRGRPEPPLMLLLCGAPFHPHAPEVLLLEERVDVIGVIWSSLIPVSFAFLPGAEFSFS